MGMGRSPLAWARGSLCASRGTSQEVFNTLQLPFLRCLLSLSSQEPPCWV